MQVDKSHTRYLVFHIILTIIVQLKSEISMYMLSVLYFASDELYELIYLMPAMSMLLLYLILFDILDILSYNIHIFKSFLLKRCSQNLTIPFITNMLILGVEPRITAYKTIVITVSLYELIY